MAVFAPIDPFVVNPMCGISMSQPASAIAAGFVGIEGVRRREQVHLVGRRDHVDLLAEAHPRFLEVLAEDPVDQADSREVLYAGKAGPPISPKKSFITRMDRCRRHPPERAFCRTTGSTSRTISMTMAFASP